MAKICPMGDWDLVWPSGVPQLVHILVPGVSGVRFGVSRDVFSAVETFFSAVVTFAYKTSPFF